MASNHDENFKLTISEWIKNSNNKISGDACSKMLQELNSIYDDWKLHCKEFEQMIFKNIDDSEKI